MFTLTKSLFTAIKAGDTEIKVNTAFNFALEAVFILEQLRNGLISDEDAAQAVFDVLVTNSHEYENEPLETKWVIVAAIIKEFLNQGETEAVEYDLAGNVMPKREEADQEQAFCFSQDAQLIYAAFWQAYGIDLYKEQNKLHWHTFLALMNGLPDGTRFAQVIEIRTCELPTGKGSGKERERLLKLKERYRIKGTQEEESEVLSYGE